MSSSSDAVQRRLEHLHRRHGEILDQLKGVVATEAQQQTQLSPATHAALGQELSRLSKAASLYAQQVALRAELTSVRELADEAQASHDTDLLSECEAELAVLEQRQIRLDKRIVDAVLPHDTDDHQSAAVIEVRAGTGGDEASLFCAELLESYRKTATALLWRAELLTHSATEIGGIREAALSVTGPPLYRLPAENVEDGDHDDDDSTLLGPYGLFKFESGVHRVQRVPINDSRIQTSACSVAVLPLLAEDDDSFVIPPSELRIETMRASGAGGQHVNTTDSAVRITHVPTGIAASIQDERSQHKNKDKALKLVTARVRDRQRNEQEQARGATRSALMGGGDRSERIRTYNYPQDRVTDHRSKTTRHGIASLIAGGELDGLAVTFLPDLQKLRRDERLQQLEESLPPENRKSVV